MKGQNVSLYQQFNGRYDFTFLGNTMNPVENTFQGTPAIFTTSSATLILQPNDVVEKAFLYWAGCGTGDFNVKLNGVDITAQRTFSNVLQTQFNFFSAFTDITSQIQSTGNGNYTLSDLDVTSFINLHSQNSTNFAGWAIVVVYYNPNLPLNQLNVYDGLQAVSQVQNQLNITLNSLNVIDNNDAKIGFLAWEGDVGLSNNETLSINGNILSNTLNPPTNAFNGTNTITNSTDLYNMDLDIYSIQNNIAIGDTSADIQMTSNQDFVMINAIVSKLNSQLPDATISIDVTNQVCNSNILLVDFTVYNLNSTEILPAGTPISIYANGEFIEYTETLTPIPIGGSWSDQISILLPFDIPANFDLQFVVDDIGTGVGIVTEINENNNVDLQAIIQNSAPSFNKLDDLVSCNEGLTKGTFNFSHYEDLVKTDSNQIANFYTTIDDALNLTNPIFNTSNFVANSTPQEIYIRLENDNCYGFTSFFLTTKNCPPTVYNYVSGNFDGYNDGFFIEGLRDVFLNFEVKIYNRWGKWLWTGNQSKPDWDGYVENGVDEKYAPTGTYYYVVFLNDPDYNEPLVGYLYLTR
ncbi:gliding motility-associated C-terminal domain-containing protein [Flavobacterium gelidilacus]|uniref:T9SS type B sorting domain-containing protein n=1 Tax=Flavobacterium gelidilacus TaxID=206041 RepID=UPI00041B8524|nr:gliding motility-associated C-terminal domain-containing protein [Flavobacterium gelidilacus]